MKILKNDKGNSYVNWVIIILVVLLFSAIIIRVLVGENGLIQQKKDEEMRNKTEKNIMIELIDEIDNN
jgi:K+-transporting ATPase A subunit